MSAHITSKNVSKPDKLIQYLMVHTNSMQIKGLTIEFNCNNGDWFNIKSGRISPRMIVIILERLPNLQLKELYEIGGIS